MVADGDKAGDPVLSELLTTGMLVKFMDKRLRVLAGLEKTDALGGGGG